MMFYWTVRSIRIKRMGLIVLSSNRRDKMLGLLFDEREHVGMSDILIFLLGGYLVPAVYFAVQVFLADREDLDSSALENVATGVFHGLIWPIANMRWVPEGADDDS